MHTLRSSRAPVAEPVAIAIIDKLRTADFRELYPTIQEELKLLRCSNIAVRVKEVFSTLGEFYPTNRYSVDEPCEICVYEQYTNRNRGAGEAMERIFGPRLRNAPNLSKMLKHGVRASNYEQFVKWYPGEIDRY
jgi:hypothetical protein